jgi:hypothetical protein
VIRATPDAARDLEAIDRGYVSIEEHQVDVEGELAQGVDAVDRGLGVVAEAPDQGGVRFADVVVVVDDEDSMRGSTGHGTSFCRGRAGGHHMPITGPQAPATGPRRERAP